MSWEIRAREIREKYGSEFMLRILAEECAELAHACLKLIRAQRRETPVEEGAAMRELLDEMTDVKVAWEAVAASILKGDEVAFIHGHERFKQFRWWDRMMEYGGEAHGGGEADR